MKFQLISTQKTKTMSKSGGGSTSLTVQLRLS